MPDIARPSPRMKLRSARRLLLFCFFFCAAALFISCIALSRDKSEVRSELEANFANGALVPQVYVAPDSRRGRYLANDCFILGTLVAGKGPLLSDVVNSPVIESGTGGACQQLRDALADPDAHPTYPYSRYFWGAKALVEPALAYASLDTIKGSLRSCVYLTLCLAAAVAAVRAVRGGPAPRGLYVTVLVAAAALLGLYDLHYFAVTLAHGFSELVLAAYLLYSALAPAPAKPDPVPWRWLVLGCFTAWFELLTGPMVMAVGLVMLVENASNEPALAPQRSVRAAVVTGLSVLVCLLSLQVFVLAAGDAQNTLQFFYHAAIRMQLHRWIPIPIESGWQIAENLRTYTAADVFGAVVGELPRLTYGNALAAALVFGSSLAALALALAGAWLKGARIRHFLVYLFVPSILAMWYLLFSNHTVIHAWGMVRIAVLLPISAALAAIQAIAPAAWWEARRC